MTAVAMSNLPNLRFRGYRDGWIVTPLKESLSFISYGFTNPMPEADSGPYMITAKEITNGKIRFEDARKTTPVAFEELLTDKSRPVYGDILLTKDGTLGRLAVVGDELFCINQSVAVLRPIPTVCSNFLYQLLSTPKYQRIMLRNAGGSTIKHIYITVVDKMKIGTPTLAEQRKIAEFLGAVDTKINTLQRKRELLAEYKRGVMQKLFSQEIRFVRDDGRPYPDWEETLLGNVITNHGGTALEKLVSKSGSHNFISIGNYSTTGKYIDNGQRINLVGKAKAKQLNKFDLVMVLNDKTSSGSLIGATILIKEDNKYVYNQRSERIICGSQLLPIFAWFLLNSPEFRKRIYSISQGGTQIYVNFPAVKKLKIKLPGIKEQQKIADFLTAIDNKITAVDQQIEQMETFKKGLLQQMFV